MQPQVDLGLDLLSKQSAQVASAAHPVPEQHGIAMTYAQHCQKWCIDSLTAAERCTVAPGPSFAASDSL